MTRLAILVAAVLLTVGAHGQQKPAQPPSDQALAPFQGAWSIVSINGKDLAGTGAEMGLTVMADKYAQTISGEVVERGAIKVDATKKPIAIDFLIGEGADAGKTQLGLVQIAGEAMTLKLNVAGLTERPTTMGAQEGQFLFVLKKIK